MHPNLQTGLFKYKFNEGECSPHQANLLFKEGLLSFNPDEKKDYEGFEIEELKFLKILYFDSGLSINIVKAMLNKLEKPYSYSFKQIYWDYGSQEWKGLPQDVDDYINDNLKDIIFENFTEFLEGIDEDDTENLSGIKVAIDDRLKKSIIEGEK